MAISYVGGKGAGTAGQGGGSITLTTGLTGGSGGAPIAGDLVVVTVSVGTQARAPTLAISTPSGYTALTAQRTTATTYDTNVQTCYKVMGGTPDTAVTIPASGNNADGIAYAIQVFRGVDTATPMDATATYATGSGTNSNPNPAAITPVTAGAWIVCCGGGAAATGAVYTAGYLTNLLTYNGPDTNDGTVGAGYYTGWTSGAYDPAAFGGGNTNAANSWGATTLALRPAVNNYTLTAQGGSYTLTGQSATLLRSKLVTASGGSYAIAGQQATITYAPAAINYQLTAQGGSYALTGQAATLLKSRTIQAQGGAYAYVGGQATINKDRRLTASGGAYQVTGGDATITKSSPSGYVLTALGGEYQLTGQNAFITVSGTVVVDTHDGFWANEQRKMWQWATRPPKLKEVIQLVQESPEQAVNIAPEVHQAVVNKYPDIEYSQIANNAKIIRFVAKQLLVQIEKRRIEIENDEEEAALLLM